MKSIYTSVAIRRMLSAVRIYCYHTVYHRNLAEKACITEYLNQTLTGQDLLIWNRLRAQERAAFVANPDSLLSEAYSLRRFNLLLQRYKREGSAYYRFWQRARTTIRTELGIRIRQE